MVKVAVAVFALLLVLGARAHPLWGDEAETALFARNIITYGVPKGWDGTNIMGINNAVVLNDHLINHTSPWAQYYLTAASLKVFGESSFTARLPSILISILTLPLVYAFAMALFGRKRVALLAVWMLALSVPFILFAYQARYYSLQTFAAVLLSLAGLRLAAGNTRYTALFVLAGALLFYANYVSFAAFYTSCCLSLCAFCFVQGGSAALMRFVGRLTIVSVGIFALTFPWFFLLSPFAGRGSLVVYSLADTIYGMGVFLRAALYPYNDANAFPIVFLPFFLFFLFRKPRAGSARMVFGFPVALAGLYLFIMAVFTLISQVDTTFVHVRYTMLVFPFLILGSAAVIDGMWSWKRSVGLVVLALYLSTNIFTLNALRSYPLLFAREILFPYRTPDIAVSEYLAAHARRGDTAFVNLDRDHEPLIFHLKDTIKFVNRVSLVNTRIFPKNRRIIPRYIYDFRDKPDWVILYSKRRPAADDFLTFDARPLPPEVKLNEDYEEIVLPIFFADVSRPELELRSFTEVKPVYEDQIFIYRKK